MKQIEVRAPQGARVFRLASLALLSMLVLIVVAGLVLTHRGRQQMQASDAAFHRGELRSSIAHARSAALSYVPGSTHVLAAYGRLEAIARGAETENRRDIALMAWETLSVVHRQTQYPGRPHSEIETRAEDGLERLKRR